jgi:hypothetical protein
MICPDVRGWMKNLENHFKEQEDWWMHFSYQNLLLKLFKGTSLRRLKGPHVALMTEIESVAMYFALFH